MGKLISTRNILANFFGLVFLSVHVCGEQINYHSDFRMTLKNESVTVHYLFYQPVDEKAKTSAFCFPAKENPNIEKALFDWPIVLQYDVKAHRID